MSELVRHTAEVDHVEVARNPELRTKAEVVFTAGRGGELALQPLDLGERSLQLARRLVCLLPAREQTVWCEHGARCVEHTTHLVRFVRGLTSPTISVPSRR